MGSPSRKARRVKFFAATGFVASVLCTSMALAQTSPQKPPAPTPKTTSTPPVPIVPSCGPECWAPRSSVETATLELSAALGRVSSPKVVVVASADNNSADLSTLFARHLAGKLAVATHPQATSRDGIKALAAKGLAIVFVAARVSGGRVQVAADLYQRKSSIWARAKGRQFGPVRHAQSSVVIDAEIRSRLAPLEFGPVSVARYSGGDRGVVAIACGDLDRDGVLEVATVSRRRVLLLGFDSKKRAVVRLKDASWKKLSPVSPRPLREPIGYARIVEGRGRSMGYLDVGLTDRAQSVRLDPKLRLVAHLEGELAPSGDGSSCTRRVGLLIGKDAAKCQPYDAPPSLLRQRFPTDAAAGAALTTKKGKVRQFLLGRKKHSLVLASAGGDSVLWSAGAQVALGDLDQDGQPEVVASRNVFNRAKDAVVVKTVLDTGTVKQRYEISVPSGVDAVAACPPSNGRVAPVVVATQGEVWVLR